VKEEYAGVVAHDPAIDHVRVLEKDARKIEDVVSMSAELEDADLIVDLHVNGRTRVLTFRQKAPVLRAPSYRLLRERWVRARWTKPKPAPHVTERYAQTVAPLGVAVTGTPRVVCGGEAERWADDWLREWNPSRAPIALCPGAGRFTKRWPEEHWLALDEKLEAAGHARLWFSTEPERWAMPALAGRIEHQAAARWVVQPLPHIAALMSRCSAAVSNDSGLMHLAAARGLRVVAIFGGTVPELGFAPVGEDHAVLVHRVPCQPCSLHGLEKCPKGHFRCMKEIPPETVRAQLDDLLRLPPTGAPC
jgi:heptosyltransferase-2